MLPISGSISFFETARNPNRLGQTTTNLDDVKLRQYISVLYNTEQYQNRTRLGGTKPHLYHALYHLAAQDRTLLYHRITGHNRTEQDPYLALLDETVPNRTTATLHGT